MNKLPDYMKIVFQAIVDVYNDYEKELTLQGRSFAVAYAKDAVGNTITPLLRAFQIHTHITHVCVRVHTYAYILRL